MFGKQSCLGYDALERREHVFSEESAARAAHVAVVHPCRRCGRSRDQGESHRPVHGHEMGDTDMQWHSEDTALGSAFAPAKIYPCFDSTAVQASSCWSRPPKLSGHSATGQASGRRAVRIRATQTGAARCVRAWALRACPLWAEPHLMLMPRVPNGSPLPAGWLDAVSFLPTELSMSRSPALTVTAARAPLPACARPGAPAACSVCLVMSRSCALRCTPHLPCGALRACIMMIEPRLYHFAAKGRGSARAQRRAVR